MAKEKCNCFIKHSAGDQWGPAIRLPSGDFANANGWLLIDPTEVRDATYSEIVAEMASRGEQFVDLQITPRGPHY
jgi:hypothetical protein